MKNLLLIVLLSLFSCNVSVNNYKDVTTASEDINFYKLKRVEFRDGISSGAISIPRFLTKDKPEGESIFIYNYFEETSGYQISIQTLSSRNTQDLTDKQYLDIVNDGFQNELKGDLKQIENVLPPIMNARVVDFEGNLKINGKYFMKRISYFDEPSLDGTTLEGVNGTNFHYLTLHNKRLYIFDINYYGNDKGISELIGLFHTIGGSISFN